MKVVELDHFGRGIVKINNKVCFVSNALTEEDVLVKILKDNKNYSEGKITKYLKTSLDRKKVDCSYYKNCGGCQIKHMKDKMQEEFKINKVKNIFFKYANIEITNITFTSSYKDNYRNKAVFHIKDNVIGYYENKSHNLLDIKKCHLLDSKINKLLMIIREYIKKDRTLEEVMIRVGNKTGEVLLQIKGKKTSYDYFLEYVDVLVVNNKIITKKQEITSYIGDIKYLVSYQSFFQVNKSEVETLLNRVVKLIQEFNGQKILDLYCGTGTISLFISKYVDSVLGIESNKQAIIDANRNREINDLKNVSFMNKKVEDIVLKLGTTFDTVIIDPPRSGVMEEVIIYLKHSDIKNIIYISCNPITQARDVKKLLDKYVLESVSLVDMFYNTYHIEAICYLRLR